jgi:hypothetical protein
VMVASCLARATHASRSLICTSASVISAAVTLVRSPQSEGPNPRVVLDRLGAAVVPFDEDESPFVGLLQVEAA